MYKVRFHMGRGKNYLKWRIENTDTKEVQFICPTEYTLLLQDTKLRNRPATAKKIFEGAHKEICAWIDAVKVTIVKSSEFKGNEVFYNPRITPYWRDNEGAKIDNTVHPYLATKGRSVFVLG